MTQHSKKYINPPIIISLILKQVFCIGLLLSINLLCCQQREFVDGRLINSKTQKPIPYASIRIKNNYIGVISNSDGGFKIPINFKKIGDTIEISSLGYKTKLTLLSNFFENQINTISLIEHIEVLNEVVITTSIKRKKLNAKEIVRSAINRINKNFPVEPFSYVGYYRDYQLKDDSYLNLNEAILAIFDPGFGQEDLKYTQIQVYKYLENHEFIRDSIAAQTYDYINGRKIIPKVTMYGPMKNEYIRLRLHDAIRNHNINTYSFVERLDRDFIRNHTLKLSKSTFFDDTPLYNIEISKAHDRVEVIGNIYINKANFGIHKLEYAVYEKEPQKKLMGENRINDVMTMDKWKRGKLLYDIKVEYRNLNDKRYLNYISFKNAFDILLPPKFAPIATEIDSTEKRFKLIMNNPPLGKGALKAKNYNLYYQKQKLKIEKIEISKNSIYLYPKNANIIFDPERIKSNMSRNLTGVTIEINNVEDNYGNIVNESETAHYNQYREFFTQKISPTFEKFTDTLYMRKTAPLNRNQPVVQPVNFLDYWMNTPLKK